MGVLLDEFRKIFKAPEYNEIVETDYEDDGDPLVAHDKQFPSFIVVIFFLVILVWGVVQAVLEKQ